MAWIESHQDIENHPKLHRLMASTRLSKEILIGRLHVLWWWALRYAEDGDLRKYQADEISLGLGFTDLSGGREFIKNLQEAGWLDEKPYFRIHDWWDYAGKFLQVKYKRKVEKWQKIKELCLSNCNGYRNGAYNSQKHKHGSSCNRKPNLTKPNLTKPNLYTHDSPEFVLSKLLLKLILDRHPKHKLPDLQKWAADMNLILMIDKRDAAEARAVIEWCQADNFWKNNILSPGKLRLQYDQLLLKSKANGKNTPSDEAHEKRKVALKQAYKDKATYGKWIDPDFMGHPDYERIKNNYDGACRKIEKLEAENKDPKDGKIN